MCLDPGFSAVPKVTDKVVNGWKIFVISKTKSGLRLKFEHRYGDADVVPGKWMRATKGKRIEVYRHTGNESYPKGFHTYTDEDNSSFRDNIFSIKLPVKIRRVHTVGYDCGLPVSVAYELLVPRDWRKYITKKQTVNY